MSGLLFIVAILFFIGSIFNMRAAPKKETLHGLLFSFLLVALGLIVLWRE